MNWTTLVSAEDLAAAYGDPSLVVVDCRHVLAGADPGAGERAWQVSHLPGAGHAHLDRDLSDHCKPASLGRHPLPEAADFRAVLVRLGITPASQVVAYDAGDGAMAAARFWWLLRLLGHRRVAVLDGGFARWTALGLPLETVPPTPKAGAYEGDFDMAQVAGTDEVRTRLHDAPGWLLDARAPERFRGEIEPLDPVAGHVPGARNRPYTDNLADGRFRAPGALRADFERLMGGRDPREVVLGCGSGVTACHNLLAMEHAGLAGARIHAASWSGWVSDASRPVATGA
ncbi:sulfurtransferase [Arenimonas daejeonensis]|uniref:sulfurtransferase n=1 Tax=Arenimonas daejeonensis TaxID=370777 RepID=UPI0011BE11A9|nr:sulfurtransferase [Arenimonas daejeonensis]